MTKFLALDMESVGDGEVKLRAISFKFEKGLPKKLDELQLAIKSEKKVDGVCEAMELFCDFGPDAAEIFWNFISDVNVFLVFSNNFGLATATALCCGGLNPITVSVLEMAKSLNFEMEQGESKCEVIMNTFAAIWLKQNFILAPYL
ncbi:MAG: hypothetical protein LBC85_03300 [Fibromonadaceae bacterium]|jgi:hypothetical protein|nr:hypothetical protein [Fibromonadaceae bacterium]